MDEKCASTVTFVLRQSRCLLADIVHETCDFTVKCWRFEVQAMNGHVLPCDLGPSSLRGEDLVLIGLFLDKGSGMEFQLPDELQQVVRIHPQLDQMILQHCAEHGSLGSANNFVSPWDLWVGKGMRQPLGHGTKKTWRSIIIMETLTLTAFGSNQKSTWLAGPKCNPKLGTNNKLPTTERTWFCILGPLTQRSQRQVSKWVRMLRETAGNSFSCVTGGGLFFKSSLATWCWWQNESFTAQWKFHRTMMLVNKQNKPKSKTLFRVCQMVGPLSQQQVKCLPQTGAQWTLPWKKKQPIPLAI